MKKRIIALILALLILLTGCSNVVPSAASEVPEKPYSEETPLPSATWYQPPTTPQKEYDGENAAQDVISAIRQAENEIANGDYDGTLDDKVAEILAENEDYQNYIANKSNQDDTTKSKDEAHVQAAQTYSGKDFLEDMLAAREQAEEEIKRGEYSGSVEDRTNEILLDNELYQEYAAKISGSSVQLQEKTSDHKYCGIWVSSSDYLDGSSNKVGNEWSIRHYASFDGTNYVEVPYGGAWYSVDHPVTLYVKTVIVEDDKYPDEATNKYSINIDTDKSLTSSGSYWTINQCTDVVENNGAYRGRSCTWNTDWTITFLYN